MGTQRHSETPERQPSGSPHSGDGGLNMHDDEHTASNNDNNLKSNIAKDEDVSNHGSPRKSPVIADSGREGVAAAAQSRSRTRSIDADSPRSRSPRRTRHSKSRSRSRSNRRRYHHHKRHSRSKSYSDFSRSRSRSPRRRRGGSRSPRNRRDYKRPTRRYSRSRSRSYSPGPSGSRGAHSPFRRRVDPSPCRVLGIFGLSSQTDDRDLKRVFEKYGKVDKVKLVTDPRTGRSRGFAFIYYDNVESAEKAKDRIHGMELDGCHVRVEYSISNREHQPTPGVYMGRRPPTGHHRTSYNGNDAVGGDGARSRSRTRSRSFERRRRSYSRDY